MDPGELPPNQQQKGFFSEGADNTLGKRKAPITAMDSAKAMRIQTAANAEVVFGQWATTQPDLWKLTTERPPPVQTKAPLVGAFDRPDSYVDEHRVFQTRYGWSIYDEFPRYFPLYYQRDDMGLEEFYENDMSIPPRFKDHRGFIHHKGFPPN